MHCPCADTLDIWSFAGTFGVTLLIMESGMHINFEKVALVGGRAFVVAILGTLLPLVFGMLLTDAFFPGTLYPDGFAAGCALAPTSVGISIKLIPDAFRRLLTPSPPSRWASRSSYWTSQRCSTRSRGRPP